MAKFKIKVKRQYVAFAEAEIEVEASCEGEAEEGFQNGKYDDMVSEAMGDMKTDLQDDDTIELIEEIV